jgi:hypothetical protein
MPYIVKSHRQQKLFGENAIKLEMNNSQMGNPNHRPTKITEAFNLFIVVNTNLHPQVPKQVTNLAYAYNGGIQMYQKQQDK